MIISALCGAIAQLVEHLNGIQGVSGSNPISSIRFQKAKLLLSGVFSFLVQSYLDTFSGILGVQLGVTRIR